MGQETADWRRELYDATPEREGELFSTISGLENEPLYTPEDSEIDYDRDLGYPGVYPFTARRLPVDVPRQALDDAPVRRLRHGRGDERALPLPARARPDGLSTAFDMPTLMGYDSDHARSLGEVGREGVAVDSLADMETLFSGIPLGEVSTSMTINAPAAMLLAFYVCVGEQQGDAAGRAARDDPDGHPQGVHRAEGMDLPARALDAARHRHGRVLRTQSCPLGTRSRSPATTSARPDRTRCRSSRSRSPTASPTSTRGSSAGSTSTSSRRGSRSSSTPTSTSSRRSRSTAPPGASGRASCASATARRTRARG